MPTLQVHDLNMFYRERGEGPTLVAMHPATVDGIALNWLVRVGVDAGFNVVTPDQRGHGQTTNPGEDLHITLLAKDYEEFLYQLGRGPVHGFGYSLGGGTSLHLAQRRPELFKSLIFLATSYKRATEDRILNIAGPVEDRSPLVRNVFDPEHGISVGWDKPLESFKSITCPTLIISADRDEVIDPEVGLALYRTLPNAEFAVIPNASHFDVVNHPLVVQAIQDFYKRIPR